MSLLTDPKDAWKDIEPGQVRDYVSAGYDWTDDAALRLTVQDTDRAERYLQSKQYIIGISDADLLYQSPIAPRYWPGTQTQAASVATHVVSTVVNSIVDQVVEGMFYDSPPFLIEERQGTTAQQARAISGLLAYQLEDIDFATEIRLGSANSALYGTEIFQWGWEKYHKKRKIIKRKDPVAVVPSAIPGQPPARLSTGELEEEIITEAVDRPTFEHIVNLREILVDPSLNVPDIRKAKFVIRRRYLTFQQLDELRDREGYRLPPRNQLLELFLPPQEPVEAAVSELGARNPLWDARATPRWEEVTSDPTQQPLEVLERWDDHTYIVVVQKKLVIHNDQNIYGKIPFLSVNWEDIPGAFYGLGVGRTTGVWQRLIEGILNLLLDQASLNLNGVYTRVRGRSIPTQNILIKPGAIIEVDDKDGFKPLDRTPAVPEAGMLIGMAQQWIASASGSSPLSQGIAGESGHSNMARSSAGAQGLLSGAAASVSAFVDRLVRQVFVPFLYELYEMNRSMLSEDQLTFILNDELKDAYVSGGGDVVDLLNARVKFSCLAGAQMQVRRQMAQGLPLLTQFLANPAVLEQLATEGKKIDVNELARCWFEVNGWKNVNDVIVPMTPQDLQRQQQQSQGGVIQQKAQAQSQLQQQKDQAAEERADNENIARAARDVLRMSFKQSVEPGVLTGEPDATKGIGSLA